MGPVSKNIGMDEEKNQKIQFEYLAGKSDFFDIFYIGSHPLDYDFYTKHS